MKTLTLLLLVTLAACMGPQTAYKFYHDHQNPCQPDQPYYNPAECKRWQKMEPKQYKKYLVRVENYEKSKAIAKQP
jgi:hypothetical protein